ncbi:MAG TPA: STAS domain-containing protein [Spirochaetota bacterium]|nr:STAS domain-containing protein [Spirochaetota bacterium]HNT11297.1 STAS domain-containing protein [Spirochaetota bacterium]HNV45548.1 STAS domain-containing protein [Spirochaetota bacterium]HOS39121.1 STAS domain-containing protein [Spirochaetota bacterium]HPI22692.1 STAS domain-containing protein [Spirochaetota bacterium]
MAMELRLEEIDHTLVILHVSGEFYLNDIAEVEEVWRKASGLFPATIAIDCAGLTAIDSSAIGTMVKFFNSASVKKITLVLYGLGDDLRQLFSRAKLDRFFRIMSSADFEEEFLYYK